MARITAHHYVLAVPDAELTAQFFTGKLGFKRHPVEDPGWRFVSRDNCMIMLGSCPDAIPPRDLGDHSYFGYLVVDDVEACFREVKANGLSGVKPPQLKPWKMKEFLVLTPDGHRLMVGENVGR